MKRRAGKKHAERHVAVEVTSSHLRMVVLEGHAAPPHIRARTVRWRSEAPSLQSELGIREFSAALKQLVAAEHLHGAQISLTLGGDYCVTRVFSGTTEKVRHELRQLEERSELYLSLGPGNKTLATSFHEIDARHTHALASVANERTLDVLLQAVSDLGLEIGRVEHSLVALGRCLGRARVDADAPVLMLSPADHSIELGISHRGQLLLDYRPGGTQAKDQIASILSHHLGRLQRYCDRYYRYAQGKIAQLYLCGEAEIIEPLKQAMDGQKELQVERFSALQLDGDWNFDEEAAAGEYLAPLGTCLLSFDESTHSPGPDLLDRMRDGEADQQKERPLWHYFMPLAASVLVALVLALYNSLVRADVEDLESQLSALSGRKLEVMRSGIQTKKNEEYLTQLQAIAAQLPQVSWDQLMADVARNMPADVWLDRVDVDRAGKVRLSGTSFEETSVYEFVAALETVRELARPAVQRTHPGSWQSGRATKFDVECDLNIPAVSKEGSNYDD